MVGGTVVIRVSALEPVVMGCFLGGDSAFLGWGCFGVVIFLGLVTGCFELVTASRGEGRFSECGSSLGTSGCW